MTQTMYAHINKIKIKKKKNQIEMAEPTREAPNQK
jgi:hypothetical protein